MPRGTTRQSLINALRRLANDKNATPELRYKACQDLMRIEAEKPKEPAPEADKPKGGLAALAEELEDGDKIC